MDWHNLTENPNDLPKKTGWYVVKVKLGKVLWESSDTTQSFSAGSVQLNDSTYKLFVVVLRYTTGYAWFAANVVYAGTQSILYINNDSGSDTAYTRDVTITGNTATFTGANKYAAGASSTADNSGAIPARIIGIC